MNKAILILLITLAGNAIGQNRTDVSLFMKKNSDVYLNEVESKSGNLFHKIGHHGPAIENQWFGLRIYFDKKTAIDVYSKAKPGLELRETQWYPSKEQQRNGWGADYFKVGKTVGLGGIRLWDGAKVIPLNPVSVRSVKVVKKEDISYMEMLSEGIPYKGDKVDILVRVTVFPDNRNAKIEAFEQNNKSVQFVTGIAYHKGQAIKKTANYIASWGIHPEDVAAEKVEIGAAIIFDEADFSRQLDDGKQHLLISNPTNYLETWITSANAREAELNTMQRFIESLND